MPGSEAEGCGPARAYLGTQREGDDEAAAAAGGSELGAGWDQTFKLAP